MQHIGAACVEAEWDEFNESAVQLSAGRIGSIKVTPGWMGAGPPIGVLQGTYRGKN